jgi:hypothetical protein
MATSFDRNDPLRVSNFDFFRRLSLFVTHAIKSGDARGP